MECSLPGRVRRLSEVGLEAAETVSLTRGYPTTRRVYQAMLSVLEGLLQSNRPVIVFIVGDWGEGKTTVYNALIRPWCGRRGVECPKVVASKVLDVLEGVAARGWGERLLYALLYTALAEMGVEPRGDLEELWRLFSGVTRAEPGRPTVIFIDEFEYLVSLFESGDPRRRELVAGVLEGLTQIANGEVPGVPLRPRPALHLAVALSRQAHVVLRGRYETSQIIGRLMRRETTVELGRFTVLESLGYFDALVRHVYGGRVGAAELAEPPTLLNPLVHATGGLPAALERGVNSVTDALTARCGPGASEKLTLRNALDVYAATRIVIEAMEVQPVDLDSYRLLVEECASKSGGRGAEAACSLLLLSKQCVTPRLVSEILGEGNPEVVLDELESSGFAVRGRLYRLAVDVGDGLERLYRVTGRLLEEDEAARVAAERLVSEAAPEAVYRLLLDPFFGYCPDGGICLNVPEPYYLREELRSRLGVDQALARRLAGIVEEVVGRAVEAGVLVEEGDAYLVPFEVQSRYIFSHELAMLRFIPREERLEVWRRVSQRLPPSDLARGLLVYAAGAALDVLRLRPGEAYLRMLGEREGYILAEVGAQAEKTVEVSLGARRGRRLRLRVPARIRLALVSLDSLRELAEELARLPLRQRPHAVIVFGVGASRVPEEARQRLEDAGIAVLHAGLQMATARRLAALGHQLEAYRGEARLEDRVLALLRYSRGEAVDHRLLTGFEVLALQAVLGELAREVDATRLQEELRRRLEATGALLPEHLEVDGEGVRPEEARDAALWLLHYPGLLEAGLARPVPPGTLYRKIIEKTRRFAIYGKRYTGVLGRDIESPEELFRVARSLEALDLLRASTAAGGTGVNLNLSDSPYVSRLVGAAGEAESLEDVAELYIDRHGDALRALLEALAALGVLAVEEGGVRVASRATVEQRLARLTRLLEEYRSSYWDVVERMGVLVYAKERDLNVASAANLYNAILERVETAKGVLHRSFLEANRLLVSAERLAENLLGLQAPGECKRNGCGGKCSDESRYTPLIVAADVEYHRMLGGAEKMLNELSMALQELERSLSVIADGVKVEVPLIDELLAKINEARTLYKQHLDESRVWVEVGGLRDAKNIFDFREAKRFCYNYKLWRLTRLLPGELLEKAKELAQTLRGTALEAKKTYETVFNTLMDLRDRVQGLTERLEKLGVVLATRELNVALRKVQRNEVIVVRETRDAYRYIGGVILEWKNRNNVETLRKLIEDLEGLAASIESLHAEAAREARLAEGTATRCAKLAEAASSIAPDVAELLAKAAEAYEDALNIYRSFFETRRRLEATSLEEAKSALIGMHEELEGALKEMKERLGEAEGFVREATARLVELVERRVEGYDVISGLASLGLSGDEARVVEVVRRASSLAGRCKGDGLRCIEELLGVLEELEKLEPPEKLVERLAASLGLTRDEVRVLAAIASKGGQVPLSILAEELGMERDRVLGILARLAERGLIELYVGARRRG